MGFHIIDYRLKYPHNRTRFPFNGHQRINSIANCNNKHGYQLPVAHPSYHVENNEDTPPIAGQITTASNNKSEYTPSINNSSLTISLHIYIFGEFDYIRTPLAQPGTRVAIHNRPKYGTSRAPYGEPVW